jgi:hypothetical protein
VLGSEWGWPVCLSVCRRGRQYDLVFVDQVSAVVPLLRTLTSAKVLFYCHFPDLLLTGRRSALHALYRAPIDWVEQATTGQAHRVLVNSLFTQRAPPQTKLKGELSEGQVEGLWGRV